MTHLLLRQTHANDRRLQRELHQANRRLHLIVIKTASHIRFLLSNHVLPIGYVDLCRYDFAR
jgi:hypothetical protein